MFSHCPHIVIFHPFSPSVVSKSLSFTEESYVIKEVTDMDVRDDSVTQGTQATESTVEAMVCYSHAASMIVGF